MTLDIERSTFNPEPIRMKLDRLIAKHDSMGRTAALRAIAARRVRVRLGAQRTI